MYKYMYKELLLVKRMNADEVIINRFNYIYCILIEISTSFLRNQCISQQKYFHRLRNIH